MANDFIKLKKAKDRQLKVHKMICLHCGEKVHPLNAKMLRFDGVIEVVHIECIKEIIEAAKKWFAGEIHEMIRDGNVTLGTIIEMYLKEGYKVKE